MNLKPIPTGRKAHGTKSKNTTIRIPEELLKKLEELAKENGISRSAVIIRILQNSTQEEELEF